MVVGPSTSTDFGCGHKLVRWLFIIFNVVFTIIGIGLIGVGSYGVAKAKTEDFNKLLVELPEEAQTEANVTGVRHGLVAVAGFIIFLGLAIMLISSCGWFGACKQNKCLLFTFSICMVTVVLVELILAIVVFVIGHKLMDVNDETSTKWVNSIMESSEKVRNDTDSGITVAWNLIQTEGECCGIFTANDWEPPVPDSCINEDSESVYEEGCFSVYKQVLMNVSKSLGAVAITFCIIEIFGVVISCYLACSMRKGESYEQH